MVENWWRNGLIGHLTLLSFDLPMLVGGTGSGSLRRPPKETLKYCITGRSSGRRIRGRMKLL
jgi:hypothetical protein